MAVRRTLRNEAVSKRTRPTRRRRVLQDPLVSGFRGALLALELLLADRAPVFVLGKRHPALDADPDADFRWLAFSQQTLQQ